MKRSTISIAGIGAIVVYLIFTLVAFLKYPSAYGPFTNWLSDLGNPLASPHGAFFYNIGCILTSLVLILFYTGLDKWNSGDKKMKILLRVAQIMGISSAFSLTLAALFPLGTHSATHSFWSAILSVVIGFFLTFSATALSKHRVFKRWIAYYGFLAALVNFIYGMSEATGHKLYIGEWAAIGMFVIYIFLIAYNSLAFTPKIKNLTNQVTA